MATSIPPLEETLILASRLHAGQVDKAGAPYILHPLRLMLGSKGLETQTVALLHDVVEDTPTTLAELAALGYPPAVLEALDCLTHREGEAYMDYVARAKANPVARQVKLLDLEDNMDLRRLFCDPTERDLARLKRYRQAWALLRDAPVPEE